MKVLVVGASRGLGRSIALVGENRGFHVCSVSRSVSDPDLQFDMSQTAQVEKLAEFLRTEKFDLVFYCAGGGPFGAFQQKKWHSHQWAVQVNFLAPARLISEFLKTEGKGFVAIGSLIAEKGGDKWASSYAASKAALHSLFETLHLEGVSDRVSLVSPGYMDTEMLPQNAWPRQQGALLEPNQVAEKVWDWLLRRGSEWHLELPHSESTP